jgi:hypothetical protein
MAHRSPCLISTAENELCARSRPRTSALFIPAKPNCTFMRTYLSFFCSERTIRRNGRRINDCRRLCCADDRCERCACSMEGANAEHWVLALVRVHTCGIIDFCVGFAICSQRPTRRFVFGNPHSYRHICCFGGRSAECVVGEDSSALRVRSSFLGPLTVFLEFLSFSGLHKLASIRVPPYASSAYCR